MCKDHPIASLEFLEAAEKTSSAKPPARWDGAGNHGEFVVVVIGQYPTRVPLKLVYMYVYIYVCVYLCVYVHMGIYIYVYIYMYIYICIHLITGWTGHG